MNKKFDKLLENVKVIYVTNEEYATKTIEEYDDKGYNNMVNMVTLVEDCAQG